MVTLTLVSGYVCYFNFADIVKVKDCGYFSELVMKDSRVFRVLDKNHYILNKIGECRK